MFLMRSSLVIVGLLSNLAIAPSARASNVAPGHVAAEGWDLYPDNLKELHRLAAEVVLLVAKGASAEQPHKTELREV